MPITMYDDVSVSLIPRNAEAVAGYVNGRWATWNEVVRQFPNAHKLSIAVSASADAECLDLEPGDAVNAQAPAWVKRQQARGIKRPVVYTSVSNAQPLLNTLSAAGIGREQVRLWTAHYTGKPHFCDFRCYRGFNSAADATQYDDKALGRSLDVSLCRDDFFGGVLRKPRNKKPIWRRHLAQTNKAILALRAKAALLAHLLRRK